MALNQLGLGLLFTATDAASGVMGKIRNGFAQTRNEAGQFGARSQQAFEAFGKSAALAGVGFAGLGALIGGTVPAAAMFENSINSISKLTDEASLNTGFLSDSVKELNARYGGGTAAQAKALYDGISAGASNANEAMALMNASNVLAVAGSTNVGVALDGLTSALNAYGVGFDQASKFSDAMFMADKAGKTTIEELSAVIGRVAPTASALGISFDELNAALGTTTAKGLKTEEAATGIKAALSNIINPTSDAAAEAKKLGVEFSAANVRQKGFAGMLKEITSSAGFNEDSLSKLFSSVEGLNTVLALTSNGGEKFNSALESMRTKAGASDRAFEKMTKGLAFQWTRLKGLFENAQISIGEALAPAVQRLGDVVARALEAFDAMPQGLKNFIVQGLAAAAGAAALAGSLGMLIHGARIVFSSLKFAQIGLGALGSAFGPVIAILGVAALAVAAFKVAIDKNIGGLGDRFAKSFGFIKTTWEALSQLFSSGTLRGNLAKEFLGGENSAVNFAVKVFLIVERIKNFLSGIADGFTAAMEAAEPVFTRFGEALDALGAAFGSFSNDPVMTGEAFDSAGASGKSFGQRLGEVAILVVEGITAVINVVAGFVEGWEKISPAIDEVSEAFSSVTSGLGELVGALSGSNSSASSSAQTWQDLGTILSTVVAIGAQISAASMGSLGDSLSSIASVLGGVVDIIAGIMDGDWPRVWRGMAKVVFGVVSGIIDMVLGMVETIVGAIDAVAAAVGKPTNLKASLKGIKNEMKGDLKELLGVGASKETGTMAEGKRSDWYGKQSTSAVTPVVGPMPAAAGMPRGGMDQAAVGAMASAAARAAVGALPPFTMNATMTVDGEVLGRIAAKGTGGRDGGKVPPVGIE